MVTTMYINIYYLLEILPSKFQGGFFMPKFDYLKDEQLLESIIPSSAEKEMIAIYGGV